jgi:hypothetical protein
MLTVKGLGHIIVIFHKHNLIHSITSLHFYAINRKEMKIDFNIVNIIILCMLTVTIF